MAPPSAGKQGAASAVGCALAATPAVAVTRDPGSDAARQGDKQHTILETIELSDESVQHFFQRVVHISCQFDSCDFLLTIRKAQGKR